MAVLLSLSTRPPALPGRAEAHARASAIDQICSTFCAGGSNSRLVLGVRRWTRGRHGELTYCASLCGKEKDALL
jgi:hypothetical protein